MKKQLGTAALLVLAAALPAALAGQDSEAVVTVVDSYHRALASGDGELAVSMLTEDAIILESGGRETKEEYVDHHLPGDMRFAQAVQRERSEIAVTVRGDVAWATSTSTTKGKMGERDIDSRGAELMVLVRSADGWKIAAIHWSSRANRGG